MLAAVMLVTAACSAGTQRPAETGGGQQPAEQKGGTLRISTLGGAPKVLHPYPEPELYTTSHSEAWNLMGAGLISIDWNTLDWTVDPRTDLATELPRVSNDGKTFTFTLRQDAKWSDGRPLTSADFLFAYENAVKPENNFIGLDDLERIESFQTPDPRTMVVTLKEQYARYVALSTAAVGPVPKHIWEGKPWLDPAGNPEILKPTVVAGPYVPDEISVERHSYVRNPSWWGKAPNFDRIEFVNASPQTALELLKTRQVEWTQQFPPSQFNEAKTIGHANVIDWPSAIGNYRVITFNLQRPLLAEKRVREALVRAVNRADLIQFEDDLAVPQISLYPPTNKWANPNVERYDFDLNRSRQLLQEAGYRQDGNVLRDRNGQAVTLEILYPTTSVPRQKMAAYLQQQWRQLGIEATVTGMEFNAFVTRYNREKNFDVVMGSWSQNSPDAEGFREQFRTNGAQNSGGYSNPRVDELLDRGLVEKDEARRKQIYDELQQIIIGDLPQFSMIALKSFTAYDKKVAGVSPLKGGDIFTQTNSQYLDWYMTAQ
jgi:peptide/nickel transport system substrate-binding protein